jgi:hypothetical protein
VRRGAQEELHPGGGCEAQLLDQPAPQDGSTFSCSRRTRCPAGTEPASRLAGHGYFTFGTTDRYVKFVVLATIDLDVDWPKPNRRAQ